MKNLYRILILASLGMYSQGWSQSTAMDFNRKDCNGISRHLFADLDSGNAVIIEYFMINCAPCPAAGQKLEAMKTSLLAQYPGKVISYAMAFNNTYSQATVKNWVTTNGFSALPMDSGATQVAYYGGMGMPTIVILAGKNTHSVLGTPYVGFNTSDTTAMASNIRTYLNSQNTNTNTTVGITKTNLKSEDFHVFPNPATNEFTVTFDVKQDSELKLSIHDLNGRLIKMLEETRIPGSYRKTFNLSEISSGNYFIKASVNNQTISQKITVIK